MAHQPKPNMLSLLGLVYWGDIGELTVYKNQRNKLVWFQKTWPKERPSTSQLTYRQAYRDVAKAWQALTPAERGQYELASRRASICMTGYNLWTYAATTGDPAVVDTIERQTKTALTRPVPSTLLYRRNPNYAKS